MSKFCTNCGAEMDDFAAVCGNCGTALSEAQPASTEFQAEIPTVPVKPNPVKDAVNKVPRKALIGAGAVVAIVVVFALIVSAFSSGAGSVVKKYYKAMADGDGEKLADCIFAYGSKEYADDQISDYKDIAKEAAEDLEDEYGSKAKVKIKVLDTYAYDKDDDEFDDLVEDLLDTKDYLKDEYDDIDFTRDDVKKIVEVCYRIEMTGDGEEDITYRSLIVAKIGSHWYIMN